MEPSFDIIVIGGGHAGVEAAWAAAAASCGARIALLTMDPAHIGTMSCNPAIGGLGKGQIVREIDAMGGIMGRAADASGILFKVLNQSRGEAVRGPRCQSDKYAYAAEVQRRLATRSSIEVIAGTVDRILLDDAGAVRGVLAPAGGGPVFADASRVERNATGTSIAVPIFPSHPEQRDRFEQPVELLARAVILTTGTFMRALMHTGTRQEPGGRVGEGAAVGISAMLSELGFELGRLKTGTPPRLRAASIDFAALAPQHGDEQPRPFSDMTDRARFPALPQVQCHLTATATTTHDLIRANLDKAPMYSGAIDAEFGPRYCPSIEDKVVRFADRDHHQVFLEPESLFTDEIYCNGISTSLPESVQEPLIRTMPGCANAEVLRWGYAVEYDMVRPHQLQATGMTHTVRGLFLAGQINGTSGYEEAAGQGLIAGLNAVKFVHDDEPVVLGRDESYIGVMMDDLVTRTPREPYRMFTSRAEHRLYLRSDNADERLTELAQSHGLIDEAQWKAWRERASQLESLRGAFELRTGGAPTLAEVARRPETTTESLVTALGQTIDPCDRWLVERIQTEHRYAGYLVRQRAEVRRQAGSEHTSIPEDLAFDAISGLRNEARDSLKRYRPGTLGQAGRIEGLTPADLTLVALAIKRHRRANETGLG